MREVSSARSDSVPEVADAGEHHRDAALVGGGDHLLVAHAAAGLDHRARRPPRRPRRGRRGTGRRRRRRPPSPRATSPAFCALIAAMRASRRGSSGRRPRRASGRRRRTRWRWTSRTSPRARRTAGRAICAAVGFALGDDLRVRARSTLARIRRLHQQAAADALEVVVVGAACASGTSSTRTFGLGREQPRAPRRRSPGAITTSTNCLRDRLRGRPRRARG